MSHNPHTKKNKEKQDDETYLVILWIAPGGGERTPCRFTIVVLLSSIFDLRFSWNVIDEVASLSRKSGESDHDFFYHLALVRQSCSHGQRFLSMTTAKIQIFHVYWSTKNYTTKLTVKYPFAHDHGQIFGRRSMVFQIYAIVIGRCDGQKIWAWQTT